MKTAIDSARIASAVAVRPHPGTARAPIRPKPPIAASVAAPALMSAIGNWRKSSPAASATTAAATTVEPARTEDVVECAWASAMPPQTIAAPLTAYCSHRTAIRR